MASYKTPGVYVEEIQSLPASVAPVATAIPAFIGYTEKGTANVPVRIKSMVEFSQQFGGPPASLTVDGSNGDVTAVSYTYKLYYSMQLYFSNGGGPCWITSCGSYTDSLDKADMIGSTGTGGALAEVAKEDEPTLLVIPDALGLSDSDYYAVAKAMLKQCHALKDRFSILDLHTTPTVSAFRTGLGNQFLSYGAVYHPYLVTSLGYPDASVVFSGGGTLNGITLEAAIKVAEGTDAAAATMAGNLTPILGKTRENIAKESVKLPASGAIAGIYARVDRDRGVWKAPANVSVSSVVEPGILLSDEDQKDLNAPTDGKAINVIRRFKGKGNLVWGARTLDANSLEWRYVPVRRLFLMVEESILKATEPMVFEPNDANTWTRVRAMIENFLTGLWRDGALQGASPEDAFFVNVGLGSTMTSEDILNGYLNIEVGIAAVRPAEFIILKFSHKLQES